MSADIPNDNEDSKRLASDVNTDSSLLEKVEVAIVEAVEEIKEAILDILDGDDVVAEEVSGDLQNSDEVMVLAVVEIPDGTDGAEPVIEAQASPDAVIEFAPILDEDDSSITAQAEGYESPQPDPINQLAVEPEAPLPISSALPSDDGTISTSPSDDTGRVETGSDEPAPSDGQNVASGDEQDLAPSSAGQEVASGDEQDVAPSSHTADATAQGESVIAVTQLVIDVEVAADGTAHIVDVESASDATQEVEAEVAADTAPDGTDAQIAEAEADGLPQEVQEAEPVDMQEADGDVEVQAIADQDADTDDDEEDGDNAEEGEG